MDKKKIALLAIGHLSCDVNGGALPAALPYLRAAHGLDYQATAGLVFAYSCLSSLIQPFFGLLADRHSKPWFIPIGVFLAGFGLAAMSHMSLYWLMFACIAISGIGSAFFHPEGARFANQVSGARKGLGMSFFSIGGNSGFILGPLLVAFFVGRFGLDGMNVFGILSACMALLLWWQIARAAPITSAAPPSPAAAESAAAPASAEGAALAAATGAKPAVNDWKEFSRLLFVILSRSIVFAGCNTFIPLYWVNALGQSAAAGATALVIFGASGVACNMLGGYLSDRMSYAAVIRLGFCLVAPAVYLFSLSQSLALNYALLPVLGCALYLPFSAQVVLGQQLLARNIGFASGVTLGVSTTIGGMAQPLLGWVADTWDLGTVFATLACVGLVGFIFAFSLRRQPASVQPD